MRVRSAAVSPTAAARGPRLASSAPRLRTADGPPQARSSGLDRTAKSAPRAEDKGFDRTARDVEDLSDLGIRASFELAHDECGALVEGEEAEGVADLAGRGDVAVLGRRLGEVLVELDLLRATRRVAEALSADVVRDLDQPVVWAMRALAALEGAVGAEERRLGDVLGIGLAVQDREGVAVDGVDMLLVELLEGAIGGALGLRDRGSHYW